MSISKVEIKKFVKLVTDEFLDEKDSSFLQGLTQDHIDAFVIPIMMDVEDMIKSAIATKVKESFDEEPLDSEDEWWTARRGASS